jgi:hypothetical protein
LQQYIVVFPDEAGATAMMKSVADPAFPACMSAVITDAYVSLDPDTVTERTALVPIEPRPLATVGDEMGVLAFGGTLQFGGATWDDVGLPPFVRVGRAVTWMNPNSAATVVNGPQGRATPFVDGVRSRSSNASNNLVGTS